MGRRKARRFGKEFRAGFNFTKKLRIITNIEDMDREVNTTVGPMPKLGQKHAGYNEEGFLIHEIQLQIHLLQMINPHAVCKTYFGYRKW